MSGRADSASASDAPATRPAEGGCRYSKMTNSREVDTEPFPALGRRLRELEHVSAHAAKKQQSRRETRTRTLVQVQRRRRQLRWNRLVRDGLDRLLLAGQTLLAGADHAERPRPERSGFGRIGRPRIESQPRRSTSKGFISTATAGHSQEPLCWSIAFEMASRFFASGELIATRAAPGSSCSARSCARCRRARRSRAPSRSGRAPARCRAGAPAGRRPAAPRTRPPSATRSAR